MVPLPDFRVQARNLSTDSENTIHADGTARQFGLLGGLVPGIVVFGYAVRPLIDLYGQSWLERGHVQIRLRHPVYDGDNVLVNAQKSSKSGPVQITVSTNRERQIVCAATADATIADRNAVSVPPGADEYHERPLPAPSERPIASFDVLTPGTVFGTVNQRLDSRQSRAFMALNETDPLFLGAHAMAHPAVLLELANQALMQNVRLGPWLHAASTVTNWSAVRNGEDVQARARVEACFERKGHEFVVLDLVIVSAGNRVVQHVTHTAIFRPNFVKSV